MNPVTHNPSIGVVPQQQRAEACRLLANRLPDEVRQEQAEALLAAVGVDQLTSQGLLGACRAGRLVGTIFSQIQPGKTALIWPPRIVPGETSPTNEELLHAASDWLMGHDVRIAEVLLPVDAQEDRAGLLAAGFEHLIDLLYLACLEPEFPTSLPQGPLQFEPYCPADQRRLVRIVEATYEQTRDCPELDDVREIEDVLIGYRATGVFDPSRWLIVQHQDEDVGCLLLTDHPGHENWELIYMGVAATFRGHEWGMDIARHAQWLTRQAGRPRLVVAVDAANEPAIRMYTGVGFAAWDRRSVYARIF